MPQTKPTYIDTENNRIYLDLYWSNHESWQNFNEDLQSYPDVTTAVMHNTNKTVEYDEIHSYELWQFINITLVNNTSLKVLDLTQFEISPYIAQCIFEALQVNKCLTKLILGNNNLGDEGAKAIATALRDNDSLTNLSLILNNIGDEGAKAIAAALIHNHSLSKLDLSFNHDIGQNSAAAIAKTLQVNHSLSELNLDHNNLGDAGAKAIAEALIHNHSLLKLTLIANYISNDGAVDIAKALQFNHSLSELNLSSNRIGDVGAEAIAQALNTNISLTHLDFTDNQINLKICGIIDDRLRRNVRLATLNSLKESIKACTSKQVPISTLSQFQTIVNEEKIQVENLEEDSQGIYKAKFYHIVIEVYCFLGNIDEALVLFQQVLPVIKNSLNYDSILFEMAHCTLNNPKGADSSNIKPRHFLLAMQTPNVEQKSLIKQLLYEKSNIPYGTEDLTDIQSEDIKKMKMQWYREVKGLQLLSDSHLSLLSSTLPAFHNQKEQAQNEETQVTNVSSKKHKP